MNEYTMKTIKDIMNKSALRLSALTENIGERCIKPEVISEDVQPANDYQSGINYQPNMVDTNIYASGTLRTILHKIEMCPNLDSLLALEPEMNQIGLTFYTTPGGKAVLCKIINGSPTITSAMSDHVVLGLIGKNNVEITDRMASCLQMFITDAASGPSKVTNKARSWQVGPVLYAQR